MQLSTFLEHFLHQIEVCFIPHLSGIKSRLSPKLWQKYELMTQFQRSPSVTVKFQKHMEKKLGIRTSEVKNWFHYQRHKVRSLSADVTWKGICINFLQGSFSSSPYLILSLPSPFSHTHWFILSHPWWYLNTGQFSRWNKLSNIDFAKEVYFTFIAPFAYMYDFPNLQILYLLHMHVRIIDNISL